MSSSLSDEGAARSPVSPSSARHQNRFLKPRPEPWIPALKVLCGSWEQARPGLRKGRQGDPECCLLADHVSQPCHRPPLLPRRPESAAYKGPVPVPSCVSCPRLWEVTRGGPVRVPEASLSGVLMGQTGHQSEFLPSGQRPTGAHPPSLKQRPGL